MKRPTSDLTLNQKDDGYRGIWYYNQSHLYFSNREGNVFELPFEMTGDAARPTQVFL